MNWIIYGLAIISAIILMPYIYRAQHNITSIIALFLSIEREDIKKKIEHYEDMREKIDTHFSKIKRFFWNTTFSADKIETKEHDKAEDLNSLSLAKPSGKTQPIAKAPGLEGGEEESLYKSQEANSAEAEKLAEGENRKRNITNKR